MADPRTPLGPILPPHMLGQAPAFHVPPQREEREPRQIGQRIGGNDVLTGLLLAAINATASGAVPGVPANQALANRSGDMLRREWDTFMQDPAMQQLLDPPMSSVQATNPLTGEAQTIANPAAPFMLLSSLFANAVNQGNRIGSDADITLYDPGLPYEEVFTNAGHPEDVARALGFGAGVAEPGFGEIGQLMRGVAALAPAAAQVLRPIVRDLQEGMARRAAQKRLQRYLRDNPDTHSGNYTTVTMDDGTTLEVPTDWLPPGWEDTMPSEDVMGAIPFGRTLRNRPDLLERVDAAVGSPGGTSGLADDLIAAFNGRIDEDGVLTIYGGRNVGPRIDGQPEDWGPPGTTSQMRVMVEDDGTVYVDLLAGSETDGNAVNDLLLPMLDFADAHGVTVRGSAQGITKRMSTDQLVDMYSKAGFEPEAGVPYQGERSFDMVRRPMSLNPGERMAESEARRLRTMAVGGESGLGAEATATLDRQLLDEGLSHPEIADHHEELAYEFAGQSWDDIRGEMELRWAHLDEAEWDALSDDVYALSTSRLAEGADNFAPALRTEFPRTELGEPAIPTRQTLGEMDPAAASEWLVALGVDQEAADGVAGALRLAGDEAGEAQLRDMLRNAYAGATDPDSVKSLMEVFDPPAPHSPLFMPSSRLYPERELANLRPTNLDQVDEIRQSVAGGDDTWLGLLSDNPDMTPRPTLPPTAPPGALAPGVDHWHSAMTNDPRLAQHFRDSPTSLSGQFKGSASVDELLALPGENGEHLRFAAGTVPRDAELIEELATSMRERGYDPELGDAILIYVGRDGKATVAEGNHRIRAAQQAGLSHIPIDVRYFGGSDAAPGAWMPEALRTHLGLQ